MLIVKLRVHAVCVSPESRTAEGDESSTQQSRGRTNKIRQHQACTLLQDIPSFYVICLDAMKQAGTTETVAELLISDPDLAAVQCIAARPLATKFTLLMLFPILSTAKRRSEPQAPCCQPANTH